MPGFLSTKQTCCYYRISKSSELKSSEFQKTNSGLQKTNPRLRTKNSELITPNYLGLLDEGGRGGGVGRGVGAGRGAGDG